jgi:hypothetical protein
MLQDGTLYSYYYDKHKPMYFNSGSNAPTIQKLVNYKYEGSGNKTDSWIFSYLYNNPMGSEYQDIQQLPDIYNQTNQSIF